MAKTAAGAVFPLKICTPQFAIHLAFMPLVAITVENAIAALDLEEIRLAGYRLGQLNH